MHCLVGIFVNRRLVCTYWPRQKSKFGPCSAISVVGSTVCLCDKPISGAMSCEDSRGNRCSEILKRIFPPVLFFFCFFKFDSLHFFYVKTQSYAWSRRTEHGRLYRTVSLHPLEHPVTASALRTPIKETLCNSSTIFTLTLRLLMSYIYGAPILDVSRSHTTTQHSR